MTHSLHIIQVESERDQGRAGELLREYLEWLALIARRDYATEFDIEGTMAHDALEPKLLLIALDGDDPAGLVGLRKISAAIGEVKRLYVRPAYRGKGVGKLLLERLSEEARQVGYKSVRLDSAPFMKSAHGLYRAAGFREIDPYPESDAPAEFLSEWLFMELLL